MTRIDFGAHATIEAREPVIMPVAARRTCGWPGDNNISPAGKIVKAISITTAMPITINQPKSITGRIPLTSKDANAIIVVTAVNRQGKRWF